jgi:hypothetical protein
LSNLISALCEYYANLLWLLIERLGDAEVNCQPELIARLAALKPAAERGKSPDVNNAHDLLQIAIATVEAVQNRQARAGLGTGTTCLPRRVSALLTSIQAYARGYGELCRMHGFVLQCDAADWSEEGEKINGGMVDLHDGIWRKLEGLFAELLDAARTILPQPRAQAPQTTSYGPGTDWVGIYGLEM